MTKIIDKYGTIIWYKEGTYILHREDGPAVEYSNGDKCWYKEGLLHRDDGPAREYTDGYKDYWLNGKHFKDIKTNLELIIKIFLE